MTNKMPLLVTRQMLAILEDRRRCSDCAGKGVFIFPLKSDTRKSHETCVTCFGLGYELTLEEQNTRKIRYNNLCRWYGYDHFTETGEFVHSKR